MIVYKVVASDGRGHRQSTYAWGEYRAVYEQGQKTVPNPKHAIAWLLAFATEPAAKQYANRCLQHREGIEVWKAEASETKPMDRVCQFWQQENFQSFWIDQTTPSRFRYYSPIGAIPDTVACPDITLLERVML